MPYTLYASKTVCLCICLDGCLYIYRSVFIYAHLCTYKHVHLFVCVCISVCPSVCICVCLSVCPVFPPRGVSPPGRRGHSPGSTGASPCRPGGPRTGPAGAPCWTDASSPVSVSAAGSDWPAGVRRGQEVTTSGSVSVLQNENRFKKPFRRERWQDLRTRKRRETKKQKIQLS